jgi:hypothetical protein
MSRITQSARILEVLKDHEWHNGQYFLRTMMISQFHARIFELQKQSHDIEVSDFKDQYGFRSYRLKLPQPVQLTLTKSGSVL